MSHYRPVTTKYCLSRHCRHRHCVNDSISTLHRLLKPRDLAANSLKPSILDRLSRAVEAIRPYHLSHLICVNYHLLPLHRTHPRVLHYRLRRLPPHAGRVVADMNSLEFTYCEGRLS